jgi:peroxiredoxin
MLDPVRHWPVVTVGLVGKVAAPVGFALSSGAGRIPPIFGWVALVADMAWWLPFGMILASAYDAHTARQRASTPEVLPLAFRAPTDKGPTIEQLSRESPVLLVFLRHAGCTFCREALHDLARQRSAIEAEGAAIVLIHMAEPGLGREFFRKYGLDDLPQISNPSRALYRSFGLRRGSVGMLLGPRVWVRGFAAGIVQGHGAGRVVGDGFQMPGIFLVFHGQILRSFRHRSAADRPNYASFVRVDAGETVS